MKSLIKRIIGRSLHQFSTIDYWEKRYQSGGNSGSGSYNFLAQYKARFINEFLTSHGIQSAIEFGCGDGNQLSLISYPRYIGLDVSRTSIRLCSAKFKNEVNKSFFLYDPFAFVDKGNVFLAELGLSLDVIFHLVEDEVYELYMRHLFQSASRYLIIYSSDYEHERVHHERRRNFTKWVKSNQPNWKMIKKEENPFLNENDPEAMSFSNFHIFQKD